MPDARMTQLPRPPWIDAHLDLAMLGVARRDLRRPVPASEDGCLSLPDLAEAPVELCLATIFAEPGVDPASNPGGYRDAADRAGAASAGRRQLELYELLEREGRLRIVRHREDLDGSDDGRLRVVVLMEGADPILGGDDVAWWFERGVRAVGLAWALGTRAAGGNKEGGPLTAEGRDVVAAMDALGMLHDASHLSDEAFDDLLAATDRRVVSTHSNVRRLLGDAANMRHLSDRQIRAIADRGGVMGLNLYGRFLAPDGRATLEHCLDHVEAIASIAGRDRVGVGSDLDGGFGASALPEGVRHPREYAALEAGLARRGWSEAERAGFRRGNWLRILRESLPPRRR